VRKHASSSTFGREWQLFGRAIAVGWSAAVVEHIAYDGVTGAVTLTLGSREATTMKIEYTVPLRGCFDRGVHGQTSYRRAAGASSPDRTGTALAHRLDELVRSGAVRDHGNWPGWACLARPHLPVPDAAASGAGDPGQPAVYDAASGRHHESALRTMHASRVGIGSGKSS